MDYTYLGRTGLQVSRLCLGTVNFGWYTEEADSQAIMDRALDVGINFFDTANAYNDGLTEEIIGRWLAADKSRRHKVVIATKVYGKLSEWPNDGRLSARHIMQACEDSLRRLGVETIDLYQMHHVFRQAPWEEIWQAMETLTRQGKIIYVGSSNFAGWHIVQAQEIAKRREFFGLVSEQSLYSLRDRMIELEVIPACQQYGVGLIPYSPLSDGVLAGLNHKSEGRHAKKRMKQDVEALMPQLEPYQKLCDDLGQHPAEVAVSWVLHQPGIDSCIIGPRTMAQLESNLAAAELKLDADTLAKLDAIWPGPGGEAPEAYAW